MQLGLIGLGKMGLPLALNGKDHGIDMILYSSTEEKLQQLKKEGFQGYANLGDFVAALEVPRTIWIMIPAGQPVDDMIHSLLPLLDKGDVLIDGGNSFYKDSKIRNERLIPHGIHYMDVGTSGGVEGARNGACLMIGGEHLIYTRLEPIFKALSGSSGCEWLGGSGAGHYVKMVHNAIEYGMMQAIGEGLDILRTSPYGFQLDDVTRTWQNGSIVSGLLMDVTAIALSKDPELMELEGIVSASGEANWAIKEAVDLGVSVPVISASLFARFKSKDQDRTAEKAIAAMRQTFGGHSVVAKGDR